MSKYYLTITFEDGTDHFELIHASSVNDSIRKAMGFPLDWKQQLKNLLTKKQLNENTSDDCSDSDNLTDYISNLLDSELYSLIQYHGAIKHGKLLEIKSEKDIVEKINSMILEVKTYEEKCNQLESEEEEREVYYRLKRKYDA